MAYQEFTVPSDGEIVEALGVEPEPAADEPFQRVLRITVEPDDAIVLSYDVPGRSMRCQWFRRGEMVLDVFREGATMLTIAAERGRVGIIVEFRTEDLSGRFNVQVYPEVSIDDRLLIT